MKQRRSPERKKRAGRSREGAADLAAIPAGAKITAVDVLKKDPNLRRISVADKSVAILPVSEVEKLGLSAGIRWTPDLAGRIAAAIDGAKARKIAMKLLSRRGLSREEVRERLEKRGHSTAVAGQVVADLESHGWIDEKAVGEQVVREAARKGPASGDFVKRKLRDRKVRADVAEAAATSGAAPATGIAAAEQFARKRLAKMDAELKPSTKARRVARALAGRGFDDETISTILTRIDLGGEVTHD
jgi:regulatory protein